MREQVQHRKLESGLNIYLVPHSSPITVASLYTPIGSNLVEFVQGGRTYQTGLGGPHFFEHVLWNIAPLHEGGPARHGINVMQQAGAITPGASTYDDMTNYWFITEEAVLENLRIMVGFVNDPFIHQDIFDKEVGIIINERKRGLQNPAKEMSNAWRAHAYHGGAKYPIIGTSDESIRAISRDAVLEMHRLFYIPSMMSLVITGQGLSLDEIADTVSRELQRVGRDKYQEPPVPVIQNEPYAVVTPDNFENPIQRADLARPSILSGWKIVVDPRQSTQALVNQHTLIELIGIALTTKGSEIREALINGGIDERSFKSDTDHCREHGSIQIMADVEDVYNFRDVLTKRIGVSARSGLTKSQLEYARRRVMREQYTVLDDPDMLSKTMARFGVWTGDPLAYFDFIERIQSMSLEEVNAGLLGILNPDHFCSILAVPKRKE